MKISFITIPTDKLEESIKFYEAVLDFELFKRFSPTDDVEIAFMSDKHEGAVELISRRGQGSVSHKGSSLSIGFEVDDIDEIKQHLEKHNVKITSGPVRLPSAASLLHAEDPNGVKLGFVQMKK